MQVYDNPRGKEAYDRYLRLDSHKFKPEELQLEENEKEGEAEGAGAGGGKGDDVPAREGTAQVRFE